MNFRDFMNVLVVVCFIIGMIVMWVNINIALVFLSVPAGWGFADAIFELSQRE